ncbi:MAG: signal recognition particle subunit SRP19/SEC65 family protein [Candidatus Bathyarchaeia archaeon]
MKRPGKMVIWLENLNSSKSRGQGRKIPKSLAIDSPTLEELERASLELGLKVDSKERASRPRSWWERSGYLIVDRGGRPRSEILRSLAIAIRRMRGGT